ncbi:hypothetical protein [Mycobacterium sp. 155]|uniref:hypothetical protein n=1 Tax=Mycobacterium sp. 155 TaxID=1157943 RepID=UPI00036A6EDA|nr:hypothetical protein [Mycobacterium sp. 155]
MSITAYGTWTTIIDSSSAGFAHSVATSLGSFVDDFDVDAIISDYHDAVAAAVRAECDVDLSGSEFLGEYPKPEGINEQIAAAVEGVDFWAIVQRHDISGAA